ncbi:MAG: WD40-repeat-containing domain protein [Benniella sp.]|nr:MAG: WD40-repeat-containing domain protein [Benniella sp.]
MSNNFTYSIGIPIYCAGFTHDDNLILAGGGGAGRSGVKNKICIYRVDQTNKTLTSLVEKILSRDEDAPMSLGVHPKEPALAFGINSAVNRIEAGENENCRVFQYSDDMIESVHNKGTLVSKSQDDYQKVTRFNKDGTKLATGGTDGVVAVLNYPTLTPSKPVTQFKGHEILDLDYSEDGEYLAVVSAKNMWIISAESGLVVETITNPVWNKKKPHEFRICRFGRGPLSHILYTVVNGDKNRKPFVCMWSTTKWTRVRTVPVGPRPITVCSVSDDGKLIAFSSSDLSIRICDAKTLKVLMTLHKAHALPIMSLAFNKDASLLVSGSVDTTCRVIVVPKTFPTNNNFMLLVMALLFVFLAALIQMYQNHQKALL